MSWTQHVTCKPLGICASSLIHTLEDSLHQSQTLGTQVPKTLEGIFLGGNINIQLFQSLKVYIPGSQRLLTSNKVLVKQLQLKLGLDPTWNILSVLWFKTLPKNNKFRKLYAAIIKLKLQNPAAVWQTSVWWTCHKATDSWLKGHYSAKTTCSKSTEKFNRAQKTNTCQGSTGPPQVSPPCCCHCFR